MNAREELWSFLWRFLVIGVVFVCFLSMVAFAAASMRQHSAADRQRAIAECEQRGGIAVVIAGEISSRGIGCAQRK